MRRDWLGRRKTEYLTAGIQERAAFYTEGMVWSFPLHFSTTLSRALQHPQERRFHCGPTSLLTVAVRF